MGSECRSGLMSEYVPGSLATVPVNVAVAECAPGCVAGVLG